MKRNAPLPPRRAPLRRQSLAAARGAAAQRRAYGAAADAGQAWCSICGEAGPTEHMHLYTQRQRPDLRNEPLNWLLAGKRCGCHRLQEHNKAEFARRFPAAWALILSRMQALDPAAYEQFRLKNPY